MFNGVSELSMEAMELSIFEMANANKKPGIKVPVKAVYNKYFQCFFWIFLTEGKAKRNIKKEVNIILKAPSWTGVTPKRAFFIKIKELTLIRDRFGEKPIYYFHESSFFVFSSDTF